VRSAGGGDAALNLGAVEKVLRLPVRLVGVLGLGIEDLDRDPAGGLADDDLAAVDGPAWGHVQRV
jgi:hypothetical protein